MRHFFYAAQRSALRGQLPARIRMVPDAHIDIDCPDMLKLENIEAATVIGDTPIVQSPAQGLELGR